MEAGLIGAAQADAIHSYETARKQGRFGRGMIGLALFAILIGVLSIIAANWALIPALVKIGAHALLNLAVGVFVIRAGAYSSLIWREAGVLTFLGLTFTFIILVGQVFQMGGDAAGAVIFWFLITLPFFLVAGGRTALSSVPWIVGAIATLFSFLSEKLPLYISEPFFPAASLGTALFFPALFVAAGKSDFLVKTRTGLSQSFFHAGLVLLTINASLSIVSFGLGVKEILPHSHVLALAGIGAALAMLHAVRHDFYKERPDMRLGALFVWGSFAVTLVPFFFAHDFPGYSFLMVLLFIAYWIFIGVLAQLAGWQRVVSLAIAIIAIRIFGIYVELFGSLIVTGFGLIIGGIIILSLLHAARKINAFLIPPQKGNPL